MERSAKEQKSMHFINSKVTDIMASTNSTVTEYTVTAKVMSAMAGTITAKPKVSKPAASKIPQRTANTIVIKHQDVLQQRLWATSSAMCHRQFSVATQNNSKAQTLRERRKGTAPTTTCQEQEKLQKQSYAINHLSQQSESESQLQRIKTFTLKWSTALTCIFFGLWLPSTLLLSRVQALANCPNSCQCDDDTLVVKCGEGALDVLPITLNPSIKHLIIKNNKIKTIDSPIQFYTELTFLDLSHNDLITIPQRTFAFQRKLHELHLNHNKIGQVNNKTFIGLVSLMVLNLRGNLLAELDDGTFSPLNKVEELNLGQNRINRLSSRAFEGLLNLRVLYLDDNTLTAVPAAMSLRAVPNLAELYLGTNSFMTIPPEAFTDLKGLTRLDLKGAGLYNISVDSLMGLEGLHYLDLSDNRLQHIPQAALCHLERLEYLSLGQNDFEVISRNALLGLKNLKRLEITGAQRLRRIDNSAFSSNTNLEYLNLSANKMLNEVSENTFAALPHVKHIILKENQINTLREGLFSWSDLLTLDLSGNPFHCDCQLLWLRMLMVGKNVSNQHIKGVICASPSTLKGELLSEVTPTMLGCVHGDARQQFFLGVLIVITAATITILALLIYTCRKRIREILKGGWGNSALGRKEREYQKTFSDEDYMTRQPQVPCSLSASTTPYATSSNSGYGQQALQYMTSRPIPVTEL